MVSPAAPLERGLRRRPAADRERANDLATADRRVDDRGTRAAAPGPRARDRHRLRLPDGHPGAPRRARLHDRAAARPAGRSGGALVVKRMPDDLLGAHVSTQGGVAEAPARGTVIGATVIQVFTKTPNQWRESTIRDADIAAFRSSLAGSGIRAVVSHDSYLINLASPDEALRERSVAAFTGELLRCRTLGIPWVVSHPGNYIDDRAEGLARNARGYAQSLAAVPGEVGVLIEGTAGSGTALGSTFEEVRALRDALPAGLHVRVGFCLDTAHLHAAGYEVATALEAVWERFDQVVGLVHLKCLHLNDSKGALGSHLDRHQWIGEGTIGPEPFRRIMRDPTPPPGIKIIETPKGDDPIRHDRRMLRRLRAYARGSATVGPRKP